MSDLSKDVMAFADQLGERISKQVINHLQSGGLPVAPEFLTPVQVGHMTGFTPKALEYLRSRRNGPRFFKVGNSVRYRASDVRSWIENGGGE
jgi:predicted DNA-binding transcriptional regulator AlpA